MSELLIVISIIVAIFNVILYVKIWIMTNDVAKLKNHFISNESKTEIQQLHDMKVKTVYKDYTPDNIRELEPGEIFVFGSNLEGMHAGGAARVARNKFGAIMGQGVGLQGQSYAIPTMQGGVETIKPYVDEFIEFARKNPQYEFLVTRIGCGIAGFTDSQIAPLFADAYNLPNVRLPRSFAKIIESRL